MLTATAHSATLYLEELVRRGCNMAMRVKAPDIVEELRNGGRLHVSVTELKRNMDRIIDFINTDDREVYITRYGVVFAKIIPFKEDGS